MCVDVRSTLYKKVPVFFLVLFFELQLKKNNRQPLLFKPAGTKKHRALPNGAKNFGGSDCTAALPTVYGECQSVWAGTAWTLLSPLLVNLNKEFKGKIIDFCCFGTFCTTQSYGCGFCNEGLEINVGSCFCDLSILYIPHNCYSLDMLFFVGTFSGQKRVMLTMNGLWITYK